MKFAKIAAVLLASFVVAVSHLHSNEKSNTAMKFLNLVNSGKYAEASQMASPIMSNFLSEDKIKGFWLPIESRYGKPIGFGLPQPQKSTKDQIYLITIGFKVDSLNARIMVDSLDRISGLLFLPFPKDYKFELPRYADTSFFSETEFKFGVEGWELNASLTIPRTFRKPPAVVLVHGSGPNDRDETVGGIKTFRDIAYGLSSGGIAVMRYEKRTKEYPTKFSKNLNDFTVWEETIEDAIEAAKYLKTRSDIDTNRIFILGHSLGGNLAPRIASDYRGLKGIIIVNGNVRKLQDLVIDQYKYIFGLDGEINEYEQEQLDKAEMQANALNEGKVTYETSKDSLLLGLPARYLLDLNRYDPIAYAKALDVPMLIINSGHDYQVTKTEYDLWVKGLSGRRKASTRFFPNLNHLLVYSPEMSTPLSYEKDGTVDESVILSIIDWIRKTK